MSAQFKLAIDLSNSAPIEFSNTHVQHKDFSDSVIKEQQVPDFQVDTTLTDKCLMKAINAIYSGQDEINATDTIIDIMFGIAMNETRLPQEKDKRLFIEYNEVIKDAMKHVGVSFSLRTFDETYDLHTNPSSSEKEDKRDDKANLSKDEERIKKYFKTIPTTNVPFPNLDRELTLEERTYIGAFFFAHTRMITKDSKSMLGYQSSTPGTENKINNVINSVYDMTSSLTLPAFSSTTYDRMHKMLNHGNKHSIAFAVRTLLIYQHLMKQSDAGSKKTIEVMKGLSLLQIHSYALTTYTWALQASYITRLPMTDLLSKCVKEHVTDESIVKLINFMYKYIWPADVVKEKKMNSKLNIPDPTGSKLFLVARLINTDYLSEVGRKGNEGLLGALVTICSTLSGSNTLGNYTLGEDSMTLAGKELGSEIAKYLEQDLRNSQENEWLRSKKGASLKKEDLNEEEYLVAD